MILHTIEQAETMDIFWRGVSLPLTTFLDGGFVQLSVVASHLLDQIPRALRGHERMTTDTSGIDQVRLLQPMNDACMFREIPIRHLYMWEQLLGLLVDKPANHPHLTRISNPSGWALNLVLLVRSMNELVARLTQRDQILRSVTTRFS